MLESIHFYSFENINLYLLEYVKHVLKQTKSCTARFELYVISMKLVQVASLLGNPQNVIEYYNVLECDGRSLLQSLKTYG